MMDEMTNLTAILVRLRYVAYPVVMVCGSGLAIVAFSRMRQYCNSRKTTYRALVSISLSLTLLGAVGWLGVVSYETDSIPPPAISVSYSMIVIWLASSLLWLSIVVMTEELRGQAASRPREQNGRKVM